MLALLLLIGAAATHESAKDQTVLCGRALAKAHSLYCYGTDIDPFPIETVMQELTFSGTDGNLIKVPEIPDRFKYRARRTAESRITSARLIRACCLKPCAISELLSHC